MALYLWSESVKENLESDSVKIELLVVEADYFR